MNLTRPSTRCAPYLLSLIALGVVSLLGPSLVVATPPAAPPPAPAVPQAGPAVAPATLPSDAGTPAPVEDPNNATIIFNTTPPATATVVWGRKLLGKITPGKPLVVVRPRDSGPLDVMVRAIGFLPVQTRAHTFSDNRVIVKLTLPENKSELWGYRPPLDAGVSPDQAAALDAVADGGVPQASDSFRVVPANPAPAPSPWLVPP